jgi:hypothetical protein
MTFLGLLRANSDLVFKMVHLPRKGCGVVILLRVQETLCKFDMRLPWDSENLPALISPLYKRLKSIVAIFGK